MLLFRQPCELCGTQATFVPWLVADAPRLQVAALRRFGGHGGRAAGWLDAEGDEEHHHDHSDHHLVHARQVMELFNDIDEDGSVRDRRADDDDDSRSSSREFRRDCLRCGAGLSADGHWARWPCTLCVHAGHP